MKTIFVKNFQIFKVYIYLRLYIRVCGGGGRISNINILLHAKVIGK